MPIWIATVDVPLGVLFRRLVGNLMIVVSCVATVIGLTQLDALTPRPSPEPELSDPPGSGLIVRSEVIHLWLPETLVYPARHELPALSRGRERNSSKLSIAEDRKTSGTQSPSEGIKSTTVQKTSRSSGTHTANLRISRSLWMFWPQSPEILPAIPLRTTPQPSSTSCPRGCLSENGLRPCRHRRFCSRPFHMNCKQNSKPLSWPGTTATRHLLSGTF